VVRALCAFKGKLKLVFDAHDRMKPSTHRLDRTYDIGHRPDLVHLRRDCVSLHVSQNQRSYRLTLSASRGRGDAATRTAAKKTRATASSLIVFALGDASMSGRV
jgi:hypothetical protein